MNKIDINNCHEQGKMILLYGDCGTGKTTSIMQTVPLPAIMVVTEPRNPKISLRASGRKIEEGQLDIVTDCTWAELMEMFSNYENVKKYKTIVIDSLSYLMGVDLAGEIEDEIFDAIDDDKKAIKTLVTSSKLTLEGYGTISTQMNRLVKSLGKLAKNNGINIILTALTQEHPKYNREISVGPLLKGREFGLGLPGFCDLIGFVQSRSDENSKRIYPPICWFESPDENFLCKYTGVRPAVDVIRIPLDLNIIFGNKKENNGSK